MKLPQIALLIIIVLGLFSCSGSDPLDQDTEPPYRPMLRPHLGDTGDAPLTWNGQNIIITDETNGIDTVSEGNFIRIPWEPFVDTDLSHIKVFRFSNHDPNPVEIASNESASNMYYLDTSSDLIERNWYSYYIHLYDGSGNYSVSDTVSYAFLAKSNLYTPENGEIVSPVSLTLKWYGIGTNASKFRVLIWDEIGNIIYHSDIDVNTQEDPLETIVPTNLLSDLPHGTVLRWRVDAFDNDAEHEIMMGSESHERTFILE